MMEFQDSFLSNLKKPSLWQNKTMGELINFPGSNSNKNKNEDPSEIESETVEFPKLYNEEKPRRTDIMLKAIDLSMYLNGLLGLNSVMADVNALETAKSYSDEEIESRIWNSNELDWQTKPAFFKALSGEYFLRIERRK